MKQRILHFLNMGILALVLAGCEEPIEEERILAIQINRSELTLKVGESFQATATYIPTHLAEPEYSWHSSNATVATISPSGVIAALAEGTSSIRVYLNEDQDVESFCALTVIKPDATGLVLNKTELALDEGESEILSYSIVPENAAAISVVWQSSDTQIAEVDVNGKVSAISEGNAIIKVSHANDPSISASCSIVVSKVKATAVILSAAECSLLPGGQTQLSYTLLPEGSVILDAEWASNDSRVASVSEDGLVLAHMPGSAVITIRSKHPLQSEVTAQCRVTVNRPAVAEIILNRDALFLEKNTSEQLSFSHLPEFSVLRTVVWSSSAPEIASVDENGFVRALEEGKAVVTVQDADNEDVKAVCVVEVLPITVTEVLISHKEVTLKVEEQFTLSFTSLPEGSVLTNWEWRSLDESVVRISQTGQLTAVWPGETRVEIASKTNPDLIASCVVKVNPIEATQIKLNKTSSQLTVGESERLSYTIVPSNTTYQNMRWESSHPEVATVDAQGKVVAVSTGSCTITIYLEGSELSANCQYNILKAPVPVQSIQISHSSLTLTAGQTEPLTVSYLPADADTPSFRWSIDDSFVASVSETGGVEALRVGTAVVRVTTADGRHSAVCSLTVNPQYNGWKEPLLTFGVNKATIRDRETREYNAMYSAMSSLVSVFNGENNKVQFCVYSFTEDNKMNGSLLVIMPTAIMEARQFYAERYRFLSEDGTGIRHYISKDGKIKVELGFQSGASYGLPGTFFVAGYYQLP
jgi:Bacterial surface proteins containing Ig-like domains